MSVFRLEKSILDPLSPRYAIALFVIVALYAAPSASHALQLIDPPSISKGSSGIVKQLLEHDWQREIANQTNAKKTFTSTQSASSAVSLAYIVNRIQHNETREAIEVANELTSTDPANIDGWLLRAWLNALVDNFDRSLIDLRSAKKRIAENKTLTEPKKLAAYGKIGKLVGYLQGPVNKRVNPDMLNATVLSIADGLQAEELAGFNKSRDLVLSRYDEMVKAQGAKAQTELAKQKAEDDHLTVSLNQQNQTFDQTLKQLTGERERLRAEGNQRVNELLSQLSPLESQLSSISSSINAIQHDLQLLYTDLFNARNAPPQFRTSTYYITDQIRRREFDLYGLQADGNSIANQRHSLQVQIHQTRQGYNNQIANVDRRYKTTNNTMRRNQIKLAKIARGPELADGKKGAMTSRLTALTSYDEFPIELCRQQLLDRLK